MNLLASLPHCNLTGRNFSGCSIPHAQLAGKRLNESNYLFLTTNNFFLNF
jgi:uncharacterized protein YjbI with pentapeptide repeats